MATSTEKIDELVAEWTGPPPPGAGMAELTIRSMAPALLGLGMLPEDPADLDGLLDYLAAQCLARRSDEAGRPPLTYAALGLDQAPDDATVIEG